MDRGPPSDARETKREDCSAAADSRGQSSVIGLVLILGLALAGASVIVVFGASAIEDTQSNSQVDAAEHVMTQFDSQVSLVALDDTGGRSVSFGQIGGSYAVHPNAGHIKIEHINYSGTDDEVIYQADMGEVVYRNGETTIAYQGGGVWRSDGGGASSMISPPEFHYRGATLTFPVIRVTDGTGGSGRITADIRSPKPTVPVYPNASASYTGTSALYRNPASDGQVEVVVESEYYRAWADYFRDRTEGNITVDHANERITVRLLSTGVHGDFQMPNEGSSLGIQGVGDHSITDFSITLKPDDGDSAEFNNLQWSMYAEEGDKQLEIHIRKGGDADDDDTPCKEVYIETTVYYAPADGDSDAEDDYHGWHSDTAFKTECYDADGDGTDDETRAVIDFVDDEDNDGTAADIESGDPMLDYVGLSNSDVEQYDPQKASPKDSIEFNQHDPEVSWEPKQYSLDDTHYENETVDRLINHYFSTMDRVELTVKDKNSNTITESSSSGNIEYDAGGQYITYMHITENEVEVNFS